MPSPVKAIALIFLLLWAGRVPELHAHGPAPVPLGVIALRGDSIPDLVRTNMGLALAQDDGSYAYGCPSQWGDVETAFMGSTLDRGLIGMVGGGALYVSSDDGCTFQPTELPDTSASVRNLVSWQERLFLIVAYDQGGAVYSLGSSLDFQLEQQFDFKPDAIVLSQIDEGDEVLLVSGARPEATVWGARRSGEETALGWNQLGDGASLGAVDFLSVRGMASDGSVWVRTSVEGARSLWRADYAQDLLDWSETSTGHQVILGPVWTGAEWIAVLDGLAARWADGAWVLGPEVNWTCLQNLGAFAFVCTLQQLFVLDGDLSIQGPDASLVPVFHMNQFGPPLDGCPTDSDEGIACQTDWLHYGGESGLVGKSPAVTPDGIRPVDPIESVEPGASAGCTGYPRRGEFPFLLFALIVLVFMRAGRRLRPGDR